MAEGPPAIPVDHAHEHPEGHEHSDVNVRRLLIALGVLVVVAIVVHVGLYWLFGVYSRQEAAQAVNLPRSAVAAPRVGPPPGAPPLQGVPGYYPPTPRQDMAALRERNAAILGDYGPGMTPETARVPIDRAMGLALEQGMFPVRDADAGPGSGTGPEPETEGESESEGGENAGS